MSVIEILFEIIVNLFEGWLYCFVIHKKFTLRPEIGRKKANAVLLVTILTIAAFYSLYIWYEIPVTDTVVWVFPAVMALYLYEEHWANKLAWILCYAVLALSAVELVAAVMMTATDLGWEKLLAPSLLRLLFVVVCNALMFAVLYAASRIRIGQSRLSFFALAVYIVINIAILVMLEMLFQLVTQELVADRLLMTMIYCLLGVEAGLFLLFEAMSFYAEKKYELETATELDLLKEAHTEEIRMMYSRIQDYRHDIKHHFDVLETMIRQGQFQESEAYLSGIRNLTMENQILTGLIAVDALLSLKQAQMQANGIRFDFSRYPIQDIALNERDLCTVLGNLLDNAIEAELRIKDDAQSKVITLSFSRTFDMFHIQCINTYDPLQIHRRGNDFLSSKRDHQVGIGIPRIRQIVDHADGHCDFRAEERRMLVDIMIPAKRELGND